MTLRIEPNAPYPVTVVADDGIAMHVRWPPAFSVGTADDPVVRDPTDHVVARDG